MCRWLDLFADPSRNPGSLMPKALKRSCRMPCISAGAGEGGRGSSHGCCRANAACSAETPYTDRRISSSSAVIQVVDIVSASVSKSWTVQAEFRPRRERADVLSDTIGHISSDEYEFRRLLE